MIKGLAITPPVIGRISIGHLVEKNGRYLPEKDDYFTLTTQVQGKDGWLLHPLHQVLAETSPNNKIRAIPVKLLFNDSDLNLRAEFSAFDRQTGRPICVGNGEQAKRMSDKGIEDVTCPTPELCPFAKEKGCKLNGRLNVQVDGQNDELGSFIFRTTGYNSVRTLAARLQYFAAVSNGLTSFLPLQLKLRAKSTLLSYRTPVFYVDLMLRDEDTLVSAVTKARNSAQVFADSGINIALLEQIAKNLLKNGQFEDGEDDVPQFLEEFYSETETLNVTESNGIPAAVINKPQVRATRLTSRLGTS